MTQMIYRPGAATTVVSTGGAVMVRDGDALAADLWDVVGSDAWTGAQVLEILTAAGLASVPQFCAIVIAGETATLLTRGECSFTVHDDEGATTSDGRTVSTWIERSIAWSATTAVELTAGATGEARDLPIEAGVVFASQLAVGPVPASKSDPEPEHDVFVTDEVVQPVAEPEPEPELTPEPEPAEPEAGLAEPEPGLEPKPESFEPASPDPAPAADDPAGDEPADDELAEAEPVNASSLLPPPPPAQPDPNATLADVDGTRFDAIFGATVPGRRLEDAAVRDVADKSKQSEPPVETAPVDEPAVAVGDHDGHTMSAAELARLRAARGEQPPTAPGSPPSAVPAVAPAVTLKFSNGKTLEVDRPVVIGRSPRAHGSTSAEVPHLVVIDNPYISGTHLLVSVDDGVVVVTDLSTNGTLLQRPDQPPLRLDKGRETVVAPDTVLNLSDDISVTVVSAGGA